MNIINVSHSFNSFNLHLIKNVFDYIKNLLKKYDLNKYEIDENIKKYIRKIIFKKCRQNQTKTITKICQRFKSKFEICKRVKSNNKFKNWFEYIFIFSWKLIYSKHRNFFL